MPKAIAASLGVFVVLAAVVHFCGDAMLNRLVRPRLEQVFSARFPGSSVRLGALRYDVWPNRLECDSVTLTRPDTAPASTGAIVVSGVKWARFLAGERNPVELLRGAEFEVADLSAPVLEAEYRVRCRQVRVSVANSEIVAQALTVQPVASEDAFFAAVPFRRVRYRLALASCSLRGLRVAELLQGAAYRAESLELTRPIFESLVNGDKPRRPVTKSPPMPHEALAAIAKPFRIDRFTVTDGLIRYATRRFEGAEPGVLTFSTVQIAAKDIANAAAGGQAIELLAEGLLMDAGAMSVQMRIPVTTPALAFHYTGKLSAMDLTRLDQYMAGAGRVQIKSGNASEALFDIDVVDGHARGTLRGAYRDLEVKLVDRATGSAEGVTNRVATVLVNQLKVRHENTSDPAGAAKTGKVDYVRKPEETFLQFAWLALRTGVLDLISSQVLPTP
jgi:hypothetical protein